MIKVNKVLSNFRGLARAAWIGGRLKEGLGGLKGVPSPEVANKPENYRLILQIIL